MMDFECVKRVFKNEKITFRKGPLSIERDIEGFLCRFFAFYLSFQKYYLHLGIN